MVPVFYCFVTLSVSVYTKISRGELGEPVGITRKDEFGALAKAANRSIRNLKNVIKNANELAEGSYDVHIEPQSENDVFGIALQNMASSLKESRMEIESLLKQSQDQTGKLLLQREKLIESNRKLEESRSWIQTILGASVDAIISMDQQGTILSVNRAAGRIFGYDENELGSEHVKMLLPDPYSERLESIINSYLETGLQNNTDKPGTEFQGRKKDGTLFPVELTFSGVHWKNTRIFIAIIRDISDCKVLERRILQIGDEERRRIGHDLHDGLGQMLTGIRMVSENLERKLEANKVTGADEIREITDMIRETERYTHILTQDMVPLEIGKYGFTFALENLCERSGKLFGTRCICSLNDTPLLEDDSVAMNIYRIIRESIHNAVKHGNAKTVWVRLSKSGQHTFLLIDDDGEGFEDESDLKQGMGIQIMKFRAGIVGGNLEVIRNDEGGTRVRCIIQNDMLRL